MEGSLNIYEYVKGINFEQFFTEYFFQKLDY